MDHRLAQILGRRLVVALPDRDVVARAIVPRDVGVVDGQAFEARVKIVDRIAARFHYRAQHPVRISDRDGRIVDEARLGLAPFFGKAQMLG